MLGLGLAAGGALLAYKLGLWAQPGVWRLAPAEAGVGRPMRGRLERATGAPSPYRQMAQATGAGGGGPAGAKPPAAAKVGAEGADGEAERVGSSVQVNLGAEAYRRGRFTVNDLEAAFEEFPVLASGTQQTLRGVDLHEMVKLISTLAKELMARAQAEQRSTDAILVHLRPQRVRCAEILLKEEFASREAMRELCTALEIPAAPDEEELSLLQKLNQQIIRPGTADLMAGYIKDHEVRISAQTQRLLELIQGWGRRQDSSVAQVAPANKRLIAEVLPALLKRERLELERAAVVVEVELVVSAETSEGVAFRESDFKDKAPAQLAGLIGADITPKEKGKDLPDKDIVDAINRRMRENDWLKTFRNYLAGQRVLSDMAPKLLTAIARYPQARVFLGRRLIMETAPNLFIRRMDEEGGYRETLFCPAYDADLQQLDLKAIPFHLSLTADGNKGFVRYMHADRITLMGPDGKGYRIDMGKPTQVEKVVLHETGATNVFSVSANKLEVDAVRMRAAAVVAILGQLCQKLVGVTQNQLLAGINELTADEKFYLDKLLRPILVGPSSLLAAELTADASLAELGAMLGLALAPDETVGGFVERAHHALRDYRSITSLSRYCKANDLYDRYEKPLRELERMRVDGKSVDEIAPLIKGLIVQLKPEWFRPETDIRFEDLRAGYADISAFLQAFLRRNSQVLRNLAEFVAGWQDTLGIELAFFRRGGSF